MLTETGVVLDQIIFMTSLLFQVEEERIEPSDNASIPSGTSDKDGQRIIKVVYLMDCPSGRKPCHFLAVTMSTD